MLMISQLSSKRGAFGLSLAVVLLVILALGVGWLSGPDELGKTAGASFEQEIPERPFNIAGGELTSTSGQRGVRSPNQDGRLANPTFTQPEATEIKPTAPDLDLVDASPFGPLPRISADGRLPLATYGRPFNRADGRPKVAIMVAGLGPKADATDATFHLPSAISLSFSPYAEDLPSLFERARLAGHEVLIELPMEPADYPTNDPGPHTLRASGTVDANIERLSWVLSRAQGYFAVSGPTGVFSKSPEADPVIKVLADKGLGMVEIDGDGLDQKAKEAGLAYTSTHHWIDDTPSVEAIDQALATLEAKAKAEGSAIGVAEAYPISLQRLVEWSVTLEQRGVVLVPVSAILIERAGLLGAIDQTPGSNIAQSQN